MDPSPGVPNQTPTPSPSRRAPQPTPTPSPLPPVPGACPISVSCTHEPLVYEPVDVGYIIGASASLIGAVGTEVVYDLYDFEVDTFIYGGPSGSVSINAAGNVYLGGVTGWSQYANRGVDNYRGWFLTGGASCGPIGGQAFTGVPGSEGRVLTGGLISIGKNFGMGGKTPPVRLPKGAPDMSVSGTALLYKSLSEVIPFVPTTKLTFHHGGERQQTMVDAITFAHYITASVVGPIGATMAAVVLYNGAAWESKRAAHP